MNLPSILMTSGGLAAGDLRGEPVPVAVPGLPRPLDVGLGGIERLDHLGGELLVKARSPEREAHAVSRSRGPTQADEYAEVFHTVGLAVLLFDHLDFEARYGDPRHQITVWSQSRG